jgi:Nif-specific ferredoxin III
MSALAGLTRGGIPWIPQFVQAIDWHKCIGCGRCLKVCGRGVLGLKAMNEEGEFVDNEEEDEIERKVMTIVQADLCIGCQACSRICPKSCYTHAAAC